MLCERIFAMHLRLNFTIRFDIIWYQFHNQRDMYHPHRNVYFEKTEHKKESISTRTLILYKSSDAISDLYNA